jgi:hypothetical protein
VFEKAEAHIVFERASAIINEEKSMSYVERKLHIKYLRKIGNPYIDDSYNEIISSIDDRISNLEDNVKEQKDMLKEIGSTLDTTVCYNKDWKIIISFFCFFLLFRMHRLAVKIAMR